MIRETRLDDIPYILPLVREFAREVGNEFLYENYRDKPAAALLASLVTKGILLVAEKDEKIVGVIGATITGNIWNPHVKQVDEIIYYVLPDHRETRLGWMLIREYDKRTKDFPIATLKLMHNSPDLTKHYNKMGYVELERTFLRGG